MIINRIYGTSKSSVAVACFLPGRATDLSAPLYQGNRKVMKEFVRNLAVGALNKIRERVKMSS
jgi:hypothetical protein